MSTGPNDLISIIVPCYNEDETIDRVLDSIVNLSYPDYEVIVVDDCSTDTTPEIVGNYDVEYLRNETNKGLAATLNRGFNAATGEYVGVLHADCVPQGLEWLSSLADAIDHDGVGAVTSVVDVDPEELSFFDKLFAGRYTNGTEHTDAKWPVDIGFIEDKCDLYDRDALAEIGGFDEAFTTISAGEDVDLSLRLRSAGYRILLAPSARVNHLLSDHQDSLPDHLRKVVNYARVDPVLYARHGHTHRLDYVVSAGLALLAAVAVLTGVPDVTALLAIALVAIPGLLVNEKLKSHIAFGTAFGLIVFAAASSIWSSVPVSLVFATGIPAYYASTAASTSAMAANRFDDWRLLLVGPPIKLVATVLMIVGFLLGVPAALQELRGA